MEQMQALVSTILFYTIKMTDYCLLNPADGRSFQHDCISVGRLIELRKNKLNTHTLIQNETQNYINKTNQKKNLIEKRIKGLLLCIISEKKKRRSSSRPTNQRYNRA